MTWNLFSAPPCILQYGATENARHENTGRSKMQGWKMRDMNLRDQIAGVETAGKVSMESQSVKKCLKVVVAYLSAELFLQYKFT